MGSKPSEKPGHKSAHQGQGGGRAGCWGGGELFGALPDVRAVTGAWPVAAQVIFASVSYFLSGGHREGGGGGGGGVGSQEQP